MGERFYGLMSFWEVLPLILALGDSSRTLLYQDSTESCSRETELALSRPASIRGIGASLPHNPDEYPTEMVFYRKGPGKQQSHSPPPFFFLQGTPWVLATTQTLCLLTLANASMCSHVSYEHMAPKNAFHMTTVLSGSWSREESEYLK